MKKMTFEKEKEIFITEIIRLEKENEDLKQTVEELKEKNKEMKVAYGRRYEYLTGCTPLDLEL